MSAYRMVLELTEEERQHERIQYAFGIWMDVLYSIGDAAYQLRACGEERQAEALRIDAESMCRRARLHLSNMLRRERDKLAQQLSAQPTEAPANTNASEAAKDGAA